MNIPVKSNSHLSENDLKMVLKGIIKRAEPCKCDIRLV